MTIRLGHSYEQTEPGLYLYDDATGLVVVSEDTGLDRLMEFKGAIVVVKEPEFVDEFGVVRKQHYGTGKQPWDTIMELGWGAVFAAANVLKYVRRHRMKNGADDLEKAKWYWVELNKLSGSDFMAAMVRLKLVNELSADELALLDIHGVEVVR